MSEMEILITHRRVSSAHNWILQCDYRRYIVDVGYKQQGTDQDPCGTPNETDWRSDVDPFTTTLCVLSVK